MRAWGLFMRALFAGLLAAALVGCTSLPDADKRASLRPTASKVGAKYAKSFKWRKTRAVATVRHTGTTTGVRATQVRTDPVAERAKSAISAMLEEPGSAEFYDLKRAQKKLLHTTSDTICGFVRSKNGPRGDTREMPFLFTVEDGQAYLVNGRSEVAETVHGAYCK